MQLELFPTRTPRRTSPEMYTRKSPEPVHNCTLSTRLLVLPADPRGAAVKATVRAAKGGQILKLPLIEGSQKILAQIAASEIVAFPRGPDLDAHRVARFLRTYLADGTKMSCRAATAAKAAIGADKAAYQAAKAIAGLWSIQVQRGWYLALPGNQHKVPLGPEDYEYPPFLKRYGG
jgi:hypothetical protein